MKTVLLYANDDSGMESRLQAALDVARVFESHIGCIQVTPFDSFIMSDPFGGIYALPGIVEALDKTDAAYRSRIEDRLRGEGVNWDWQRYDGAPAQIVTARSALSDLIILSLPGEGADYDGPLSIAGDVVIHARAPVLAIPQASRSIDCLGPAILAWNGAIESTHALRLTLSMLGKASSVHIVTVTDDRTGFPAIDASQYLSRHGIGSELHEWPRDGRGTAEALLEAAAALGAGYVVMGAYGHSRLSETILGGATRDMLRQGMVPLLLAH
jgi:nucleotide-binding universal stress UspA family protein